MITAYICAPVRGKEGNRVTHKVKWDNVNKAIALGLKIRARFPQLDLFIPHEHEVIVEALQRRGLSSDDVISACCDIVKTKDLIIVYRGNWISGGMGTEIGTAILCDKTIIDIDGWNGEAELAIAKAINEIEDKIDLKLTTEATKKGKFISAEKLRKELDL